MVKKAPCCSQVYQSIRAFPDGIMVWGARTMCSIVDLSESSIPARRLRLYIEESIYQGFDWIIFEPNDEALWADIRQTLQTFLFGLYRQGAFPALTPSAAYFVKCDRETTSQMDMDRNIVRFIIGIAPVRPAEFVIIEFELTAGPSQ